MRQNNALQVYYDERLVGTLAMTADHKAAFQYDDEWLENGFSIRSGSSAEDSGVSAQRTGETAYNDYRFRGWI